MRMGRIIGSNIRTPHIERIQATDWAFCRCTYTVHGRICADNPTTDFESGAAKSLATSRLVDCERDDGSSVRPMQVE